MNLDDLYNILAGSQQKGQGFVVNDVARPSLPDDIRLARLIGFNNGVPSMTHRGPLGDVPIIDGHFAQEGLNGGVRNSVFPRTPLEMGHFEGAANDVLNSPLRQLIMKTRPNPSLFDASSELFQSLMSKIHMGAVAPPINFSQTELEQNWGGATNRTILGPHGA